MFCCDRLQARMADAGQRGLAVLVRRLPELYIFYLQSRTAAAGEEEQLLGLNLPVRMNIVSSIGIVFCPWCGTRLDDLVSVAPERFAAIAKQHEHLIEEV